MVRLSSLCRFPDSIGIIYIKTIQMLVHRSWHLLLLLVLGVSCFDYDDKHTLKCSDINDSWTYYQNVNYLWNILELHIIDRYTFLIVCPIVMICHFIIILTFVRYKLLKHSPEDVVFAILIAEGLLNMSLFSNAIYDTIYQSDEPMPVSFPAFCYSIGVINTFTSMTQIIYLIYFLIHVILNVNKSIKQNKWFTGNCRHILPVILSIAIVLVVSQLGWIGLSELGICQISATRENDAQLYFPIVQLCFSFGFIIFSIYVYHYFRHHMPEGTALTKRKYEENLLITRFTIGMSIIQVLYATAVFLLYLNCRLEKPQPNMLIFATVFNLTRIIEFAYLITLLVLYKKIGNKIKKLLRSCFSRQSIDHKSQLDSRRVSNREIFELIDLGLKEKILDILEDENQIDFIKVTQVMTMLVGVRIAYREYLSTEQSLKPIKNIYYKEEITFRINSKWLADFQQEAMILPRLSLLDGRCTIYSPQIFKRLLKQDQISGIEDSFDLIKNSQQLYQACESRGGGGGRSGQFFFFSSDNKYILKTVNKVEFEMLLEELPLFYQHFVNYPDTLICKIYGMFKLQHQQISRKYYILLMKNISGCPKQQIKRTYDMKGSTDDRKVLKDSETELPLFASTVYKDLDFIHLQHKLYIPDYFSREFKEQLKIDTFFLKDLNIIDYSLLVMKVEWMQEPQQPRFWAKLQRIPSNKYQRVYYHMSLIDVSQKWDRQKRGENWWKKLLGKKDTSAQQPSFYQARFMNFIREITTFDLDNLWSSHNRNNESPTLSEQKQQLLLELPLVKAGQRTKTQELSRNPTNVKKSSQP